MASMEKFACALSWLTLAGLALLLGFARDMPPETRSDLRYLGSLFTVFTLVLTAKVIFKARRKRSQARCRVVE